MHSLARQTKIFRQNYLKNFILGQKLSILGQDYLKIFILGQNFLRIFILGRKISVLCGVGQILFE